MRVSWIGLIGLVPLLAVGMLLLGTSMGTVPFEHVQNVGWSLGFGCALLLIAAVFGFRQGGAKVILPYLMIALSALQGAGAAWVVPTPDRAAAHLVTLEPDRMGELLAGYVTAFGDSMQARQLADHLADHAPYPQIFAFHMLHPDFSHNAGVVDRFVTRMSAEEPTVILEQLEGAVGAFGNEDRQLGPLAAVLDIHADELDHGVLDANAEHLYELAPPDSPFQQLSRVLIDVTAERADRLYLSLQQGDRAFADLARASAQDGDASVRLDESGAPAGLHVMDHLFPRWYLRLDDEASRQVRVHYRELRAGEIVRTDRGVKPVDIVKAEFSVRVTVAGEVTYEHTFRGESPIDSWKLVPDSVALRQGYRDVAVDALSRELATHFADVRVE